MDQDKQQRQKNKVIGEHIRYIRYKNKITQDELGKMLCVSPDRIRDYESGRCEVPFDQLCFLATHYSMSVFLLDENKLKS